MKFNHNRINELIFTVKSKKETIEDLSKKIGISLASFNRIKEGITDPSLESLIKIAIYFKKDLNYFFDFKEEEKLLLLEEPKAAYNKSKKTDDCNDEIEFYKKELDRVHGILEMFKSGEIKVVDKSKDRLDSCG